MTLDRVAVVNSGAGMDFAVHASSGAGANLNILNTTIARNAAFQHSGLRYAAHADSSVTIVHHTILGNRSAPPVEQPFPLPAKDPAMHRP